MWGRIAVRPYCIIVFNHFLSESGFSVFKDAQDWEPPS